MTPTTYRPPQKPDSPVSQRVTFINTPLKRGERRRSVCENCFSRFRFCIWQAQAAETAEAVRWSFERFPTPLKRGANERRRALSRLLSGRVLSIIVGRCLASTVLASDLGDIVNQADGLERAGHFREAAAVLTHALATQPALPAERQHLEFELDRLERIRKDFAYTHDQLYVDLKKTLKEVSMAEYEQWIREGRFDTRDIDGEQRFMASSVSNLFFRYPELYARRIPPKNSGAVERLHWETCQAIKAAALAQHGPYVLPKRFEVTMTITADPNAAPDGEVVRAWLPIPREYPFQSDFALVMASPNPAHIDDAQSAIRSIYLEQPARKSKPTKFTIEYTYTAHGVSFDVKPEEVRPKAANDPVLATLTQEGPHIVFTPEMRALSQQIAGDQTNPYLKARKFYDWISENIKYSFAIEYSTIRNISEYCRSRGYGDCGQEALLFITLCRLNGIPARWQSGWNTFPGAKSNHDWSEIYIAPYGWIPVDPYMGIYAMRYATTLTPEQRRDIRDFYFGGLDQYRMAANSDHNQTLIPTKNSMRSDDVDFQRGELEWGSHNIYFDAFSYQLDAKEVNPL